MSVRVTKRLRSKNKSRRHACQSANDKENAVGVNEAVRGAQAFDRSAGKSLQDLSQPGIGGTQERILRGGVTQIGETRHVRDKRNAGKADTEVVSYHDEREERNAGARERETRIRGNRGCLHNAPDDERAHVAKLQRAESAGGDACKRSDESDGAAHRS